MDDAVDAVAGLAPPSRRRAWRQVGLEIGIAGPVLSRRRHGNDDSARTRFGMVASLRIEMP
jgi:hypothetical protein